MADSLFFDDCLLDAVIISSAIRALLPFPMANAYMM
jgi:hypothetical protein